MIDLMYAHDTEGGGDVTPAAEALAEEAGVDLSEVEGHGQDGRILKSDVEAAIDVPAEDAPGIDPETDTANDAAVEAFFDAEPADGVKVSTILPLDTHSGYPEGSYPEAQARGDQFDKGTTSIVSTGKQEEAAAFASTYSKSHEVEFGPDDAVGKNQAEQEKLARKRDRTEVQNVKLGNAEKNPETA